MDVVIVCDNTGRKLDELPVSIQRESKMKTNVDAAHGSMTMPASHPKATYRNLRYGNLVYVVSDQSGIPPWCGVIWPSTPNGTEIKNGQITLQLRSTEWLLATRNTALQDKFSGKPGEIFSYLLKAARRDGYLPIGSGSANIDMTGDAGEKEYNLTDCYQAANELASANDMFWFFYPTITAQNMLTLNPFWVKQKSNIFKNQLSTGGPNANFAITSINEAVDLANMVYAYGRFDSWDDPVWYAERHEPSIGKYGQVYAAVIAALDETTVEGLIPIVKAELTRRATPPLIIDGLVLSPPFPRVGDVTNVLLVDGNTFVVTIHGSSVKMQVESTTYTPQDGTLAVHLMEIT